MLLCLLSTISYRKLVRVTSVLWSKHLYAATKVPGKSQRIGQTTLRRNEIKPFHVTVTIPVLSELPDSRNKLCKPTLPIILLKWIIAVPGIKIAFCGIEKLSYRVG